MAAPIPLKIVIVGDGGVGKSSVTMSLLNRDFSTEYDPTIEDSYSVTLAVEGKEYAVEIIDTAGQEEYRGAWGEQTVREGDGFILTYAIDSQTSFDLLPSFAHTIRKAVSEFDTPPSQDLPENTPFPFLVLGNKCDLPSANRQVSAQTALSYSRGAGGLFYECSAKQSVNISAAFTSIVRAAAKSKVARAEWIRRHGGSDEGYNGNVAFLERGTTFKSGVDGWDEEDREKAPKKRNPNLAMDRNATMSRGGLAYDDEKKGCGCVIC